MPDRKGVSGAKYYRQSVCTTGSHTCFFCRHEKHRSPKEAHSMPPPLSRRFLRQPLLILLPLFQ